MFLRDSAGKLSATPAKSNMSISTSSHGSKALYNVVSVPAYYFDGNKFVRQEHNNPSDLLSKSVSTKTISLETEQSTKDDSKMRTVSLAALAPKQRHSVWERWDRWAKATMEFFPYSSLRARVKQAMKEGKIFSVTWGPWYAIRRALNRRGWVEKPRFNVLDFGMDLTDNGELRSISDPFTGGIKERDLAWVLSMLQNYQPNFVWNMGFFNPKTLRPGLILNRQPKPPTSFHTKVGIVVLSQTLHWYQEERVGITFIPRCYRLFIPEELATFIGDYYLTACVGLLEWIVGAIERSGDASIIEENGAVHAECVLIAIRQVDQYIRERSHAEIDSFHTRSTNFGDEAFDKLLQAHRKMLYHRAKLTLADAFIDGTNLYVNAKRALRDLVPFWPQMKIDGTHNLWICKPGYQMRGDGVTVRNDLSKILNLLEMKTFKGSDSDWVVQKYIERPLLIFSTKFDIRQWFLVTSFNPLVVWFYRDSYLRFCSKPFATEDFDERIHLCNSAVQSKYSYSTKDTNLPKDKIWDSYTFQAYLKSAGHTTIWEEKILPGMKQALVGVLLASQDTLFECPSTCFQLYGADFMLSEDMRPWIIEINNLPLLSSSCPVLSRMSKAVLEDTMKVVLDYPKSRRADTGMFELIFQQESKGQQWKCNYDFVVKGTKLGQASNASRCVGQQRPQSAMTMEELQCDNDARERPKSMASGALSLSARFRLQDPPRNIFCPNSAKASAIKPNSAINAKASQVQHPKSSDTKIGAKNATDSSHNQ